MSSTVAFSQKTRIKEEPIIVYGASVYGELAYVALKQMGYKPDYYCDRSKYREEYLGINVIGPEVLKEMKKANVIIASADFFGEIKFSLEKMGCENLFDMTEMLKIELPKEQLSNRALEMYDNRQHYMDVVQSQADEKLVFNRIQYVVTEKCSLKCKDCSHLIQYYQHPQNIELSKYKSAFDHLLAIVDSIAELRILGGEPFLNADMGDVIEWYHDSDKIQSISVYTNGTIVPNDRIMKALQKSKVKVHISNYGINEKKIEKVTKVFDEYRIKYFVRKYDAWQDAGGVEFRGYSLEKKKAIFSECFERNGFTFLNGNLHRCPRAAHAINLKVMPDIKEDYVDLLHWSGTEKELEERLKKLRECSWLEACDYCGGPNNHMQNIPAGRQIAEPIAYEMKC